MQNYDKVNKCGELTSALSTFYLIAEQIPAFSLSTYLLRKFRMCLQISSELHGYVLRYRKLSRG